MDNITPDLFINTLFPPDLLLPDERVCIACPDSFVSKDTGERVDYYRQFNYRPGCMSAPASYYFCLSTVERQRRRQIRKRLDDVRTAMVLVVDDVGTKSKSPPVAPSYVLETSAGNYQYGYLLEPFDVSGAKARAYYDGCLLGLAHAGYNDPGFRSANRLGRVPGSLHSSGFVARVVAWAPGSAWELGDLMAAMAVAPAHVTPRSVGGRGPGAYTALADVVDPIYLWLAAAGQVYGHNSEWVHIECPWRVWHTDGAQGGTATGFSPDGYGREGRAFKCQHGHCAKRTTTDFINWAHGAMHNDRGTI
jgi:hypothetical protein